MRAAWKVTTAEEGEKRLEQLARFLERDLTNPGCPQPAREGMAEMFTLQRPCCGAVAIQVPGDHQPDRVSAGRCRASRISNVTRWRDADMVERWVACSLAAHRNAFPQDLDGHRDLWAPATIPGRQVPAQTSQEAVA